MVNEQRALEDFVRSVPDIEIIHEEVVDFMKVRSGYADAQKGILPLGGSLSYMQGYASFQDKRLQEQVKKVYRLEM